MINIRVAIFLIVLWLLLLGGVLLYYGVFSKNQISNRVSSPLPPSPTTVEYSIHKEYAPYVGRDSMYYVKPKQIIELFIDSINTNDLDTAVSMMEPNYYLKLLSSLDDFYGGVKLWEPGQVKKYSIEVNRLNVSPLPCSVRLTMLDNTVILYELELVEMTNFDYDVPVNDWFIQNIININ